MTLYFILNPPQIIKVKIGSQIKDFLRALYSIYLVLLYLRKSSELPVASE